MADGKERALSEGDRVDPLGRNIHAITELRARFEQQASRHQRLVERATWWLGRPKFLYGVLVAAALWVLLNVLAPHAGYRALDPPPFNALQGLVSFFALVMTTVVLITQNRQGRLAEQREELALQIDLLTEQRTAKIIALLEEFRRDMPLVPSRSDPEAEALTETVDPHVVLTALEYKLEQALTEEAEADIIAKMDEPAESAKTEAKVST